MDSFALIVPHGADRVALRRLTQDAVYRILGTMDAIQLDPVRRAEPVAERVYQELRAALLRRSIAPRQRLVEADLAQRLGVSRTPVREALTRLATEGMVVVQGASGLVAADVGSELADIYGIRQVLEGYAARLASTRMTPAELDRLDLLARQLRAAIDAGDLERQAESNNAFHLAVAEASRSTRLVKLIADYREYFLNP